MPSKRTVYLNSPEEREAQQKKKAQRLQRKKKMRMRFLIYTSVASITFIIIFVVYLQQGKALAQYMQEKEQLEERLAEVQREQETLQFQLQQLDDDEYIEKLARQQYLVGKKGEIIFSLPTEDKHFEEEEKNDEKKE